MDTAFLIRTVVSNTRWNSAEDLIKLIKQVGNTIEKVRPVELCIGNIVRRILHMVREEFRDMDTDEQQDEDEDSRPATPIDSSMYNLLADISNIQINYDVEKYSLKAVVIQGINVIIDELETLNNNIAAQSLEHIHSNEIIMTLGYSKCVLEFLLAVGKKRKFQVVVAETSPTFFGQRMALELSQGGIETTLITDSAVFALMARVNKVILGCHVVTADGGLLAIGGTRLMATAAKHYSTPVVVITGMYKLSPIYPYDHNVLNTFTDPSPLLPFSENVLSSKIDVINPMFDCVSPDLIDLFITNLGGNPPSYIYRLLDEHYDSCDYRLNP